MRGQLRKFLDYFSGDRVTFDLRRGAGQEYRPDALFNPLNRYCFSTKEFVLYGKAAAAPTRHTRIHVHNITKGGGYKEAATRLNQRDTGDIVLPEHFSLLDSERAVKERIRARIKVSEIAGEKNNPKGIAISPFNVDFFPMDKHFG